MNGFLLWGLVLGVLCLGAYVTSMLMKRKAPVLAHGVELLISGSGFSGGMKICWLVFSGEMSRLIEAKPPGVTSISPEDVIYLAVGGIALGWLSLEMIVKRFTSL